MKSVKDFNKKRLQLITVVLGVMFLTTVLMGIVFFYIRTRYAKEIIEKSDYKTYNNYYVLITDNAETDYWRGVYSGAEKEAEKLNAHVEVMGEGLDKNLTKEDYIRIALSAGADGIIVEGDDNKKIQQLLLMADEYGVPVVAVSEDCVNSGRKSFIGVSSFNIGKEYGNQIAEYAKENESEDLDVMVLMDENMTKNSQTVVMTAIRETLVNNNLSDRVSLDSKEVSSNVDYAAEEEIRDIFVGNNEIPDVMICLSEQSTICAYQVVVDHNKVGQVEIFGYYMSDKISEAIDKKIIRSSIVVDTEQIGSTAVKALDEYKESGYVSDFYLIDTSIANYKNIASFMKKEEGGETDD
ncbi:MAG: substrate-binding domain-containing protein [Eubacterium sp.]|nr:substrate-binding domain-containing protein [Eubacterium sp.]